MLVSFPPFATEANEAKRRYGNYPQPLSLWVTDAGLRSLSWPYIWNHCIWERWSCRWNQFFLKEERDQNQQAEASLWWLTSHLKEDLYCRWDNIIAAAARTTHRGTRALAVLLSRFCPRHPTYGVLQPTGHFPSTYVVKCIKAESVFLSSASVPITETGCVSAWPVALSIRPAALEALIFRMFFHVHALRTQAENTKYSDL